MGTAVLAMELCVPTVAYPRLQAPVTRRTTDLARIIQVKDK